MGFTIHVDYHRLAMASVVFTVRLINGQVSTAAWGYQTVLYTPNGIREKHAKCNNKSKLHKTR